MSAIATGLKVDIRVTHAAVASGLKPQRQTELRRRGRPTYQQKKE
jgi:hypothetical protein